MKRFVTVSIMIVLACLVFIAPRISSRDLLPTVGALFGYERSDKEDVIYFRNSDVLRGTVVDEEISIITPYGKVPLPVRKCAGFSFEGAAANTETVITVNSNRLTGIIDNRVIKFQIGSSGEIIEVRKEKVRYVLLKRTANELDFIGSDAKSNLYIMANGDLITGEASPPSISIRTDYADIKVGFDEIKEVVLQGGSLSTVVITKKNGDIMRGGLITEEITLLMDVQTKVEKVYIDKLAKIYIDEGNSILVSVFDKNLATLINPTQIAQKQETNAKVSRLAAGAYHTVGLKADGTVVAVGDSKGYLSRYTYSPSIDKWNGIISVAAGEYHTVGLKSDGTVVAAGDNDKGQLEVYNWTGIISIAAGEYHTVGLKSDGTVVAVGDNGNGQLDVSSWKNIIAVGAGDNFTLGITTKGTVLYVGGRKAERYYDSYSGATATTNLDLISDWKDIGDIDGGSYFAIGLKANGTVITIGRYWTVQESRDSQYKRTVSINYITSPALSDWRDIISVSAQDGYAIGLRSNGSVVLGGDISIDVSKWENIVAIAAGSKHIVGIKKDGTVVAAGENGFGQCNVTNWKL